MVKMNHMMLHADVQNLLPQYYDTLANELEHVFSIQNAPPQKCPPTPSTAASSQIPVASPAKALQRPTPAPEPQDLELGNMLPIVDPISFQPSEQALADGCIPSTQHEASGTQKVNLPGQMPVTSDSEGCWFCRECGDGEDLSSSVCRKCESTRDGDAVRQALAQRRSNSELCSSADMPSNLSSLGNAQGSQVLGTCSSNLALAKHWRKYVETR